MKRVHFDPLPDDAEPLSEIIGRKRKTFRRRATRRAAEKWLPIYFPETRPFGVLWFGDPHLDDDACNWDLLGRHVDLCRDTPGLYAANVGDYRNNWVGRLVRLYAEQQTTHGDGWRLAQWFLREAGVPWSLLLLGNHDLWNEGEAIHGLIADNAVHIAAWEARVEFRDTLGNAWRVHAAHDFPGQSIYNKTHAPARKAMFTGGAAELYVCGHRHTFGLQSFEIEETGAVAHAVRCRGYKWDDRHALVNGFPQGEAGAAVLTIFNPHADTPAGRVLTFADPVAGAAVLSALREDSEWHSAPSLGEKRKTKPRKSSGRSEIKPMPNGNLKKPRRKPRRKSPTRSPSAAGATGRSKGTRKSRKRSKRK